MSTKPYIAPNPLSKPIGAFFRWEIPGEAVGVHLSLNVIELLERDAVRAGEKMTAGVLLGRKHHGRELTLTVEHYESATPERGSTTSPFADPQALEAILNRWRPGRSRMSVLGFYRSCPEEATLSADDLAAVQATLPEANGANGSVRVTPFKEGTRNGAEALPTNREPIQDSERVFLLIEPRAGRVSTANLYLARKGVVVCQSPRMPFNRAELSKNEATAEAPAAEQSPRQPAYTPAARHEHQSEQSEPKSSPRQPAKGFMPPWLRRWQWAIFAFSALPLLIAVFVSVRSNQSMPHFPTAANASTDSLLDLKLDRSGSALKLSWDATAASVRAASDGHLLITDGVIHRDLELTPSDLRGGTIFYTPLTDDVVLQLQLDGPGSEEPLSASVRTLGGGLSPASATSIPAMPSVPPSSGSYVPPLDESSLRASSAGTVSTAPPVPDYAAERAALNPSKPTTASLLPSKPAPESKVSVPRHISAPEPIAKPVAKPAPTIAANISSRPATIAQNPAAAVQLAPETVPVVPVKSAATPSGAVEASSDPGGAIEVARLLSREDPVYPDSAKELGLAGTVEVHFKIGRDGQVHDVTVVNGFSVLANAAVEAVSKWRYTPAKIDGVPTDSEASAVFVFKRS